MASRRKGHAMPRGFVSKAQWRMFFARGRRDPKFAKLAHKEARKTPGGPKVRFRRLPPRKDVSVRTGRKATGR